MKQTAVQKARLELGRICTNEKSKLFKADLCSQKADF